MVNFLPPMQMGLKERAMIHHQLRFFQRSQDHCPPSLSNLHMLQLGLPPVLQPMRAVQSTHKVSFFTDLQWQSSIQYHCWCQAHPLSFKVTGDDFAATAAELFWCCLPFETQRGDRFWGHLEHLSALHETAQTSEKCWITLVFHFLRLHIPFQQFLLQFYQL